MPIKEISNSQNKKSNEILEENITEAKKMEISKQQTINEEVKNLKEEIELLKNELQKEKETK